MSSSELQKQLASSYLSGGSMAYVDGLYEDYLIDPQSVPAEWREVFDKLPETSTRHEEPHRSIREHFLQAASMPKMAAAAGSADSKQYKVAHLINAYRSLGHHAANLDPLDLAKRHHIPNLELAYHELSNQDLDTHFYAADTGFNGQDMSLRDLLAALKDTYCRSIGIEYMHISNHAETEWLQNKMESVRGRPSFSNEMKKEILRDLVAADGLERYLGTKYVGQKRFSLEGGDAFIPLLKELIQQGAGKDVKEMIIGMAHRGRLNVLVNVLGKEPSELFQEFEGKIVSERTGDVKYHMGFSSDLRARNDKVVHLALAFNPSHLEIIGPVVEGSVRSRQRRRGDLEKKDSVVPILVHGDAAFSGQGVVMETFNFSQARGLSLIHI